MIFSLVFSLLSSVTLANPQPKVLLLGDSLAEGISPYLKTDLGSKVEYHSLYKRGTTIPFWNSNADFNRSLKDKYDIILVSLGTNDLKTKPTKFDSYYQFYDKLAASGAKVYWIIPPVMPFNNEQIIDMIEHPPESIDKIDCPEFERAKDKVHLTPKGYKDWAQCISDSLPL